MEDSKADSPPRRAGQLAAHARSGDFDRILRTAAVADLLGVSRATLWRWHSSGHFPSPLVLGQGASRPVTGWRESQVMEWLATRPTLAEGS